jgi:hypothetical protein
MQNATAVFRNGRVELAEPVDWPDGTQVEIHPIATTAQIPASPMTAWPARFFDELRQQWGEEPFDRPSQGENETREDW